MTPQRFAKLHLEVRHISTCLCIVEDIEYRQLRNGVRLQLQHKDYTILVNFPGTDEWHDYTRLWRSIPPSALACAPLGSFPRIPPGKGTVVVGASSYPRSKCTKAIRRPSRLFLVSQIEAILQKNGPMPLGKIRVALNDKDIFVSAGECSGAVRCLVGQRRFGKYPHTPRDNGGPCPRIVPFYYLLDTGVTG